MVRRYVRKMKQASWNETSMTEAILALKINKMGLRKAARIYDVQKILLEVDYRSQKKVTPVIILILSTLGRFGNVLSESQEEDLGNYITDMDKAFYGLTIMDIRVLVLEYCKRNEIDNPFSKEIKLGLKYILVKYFVSQIQTLNANWKA